MDNMAMQGLAQRPRMPRGQKDMRKHGVRQTVVDHLHDGSHKMTFHHIKSGVESPEHSAPDMEAMHDKLEEMLGGKPGAKEME